MTAQEFILQKKSEFPFDKGRNDSFFKSPFYKKMEQEGKIHKDTKDLLRNMNDWAVSLFEAHRQRIPTTIIDLYEKGKIAIGEINNELPNARYYKLGELNYAVTINTGLIKFIHRVIRAYSTRYNPPDDNISFEETCQKIADIFWWFGISEGRAFGPDYPITEDQIIKASKFATEAEFFFLAHELGHVFNDIFKNSEVRDEHNEEIEEFAADMFALGTCLGLSNGGNYVENLELDFIYASCELALLIFDGLEQLGFETEKTHPSAEKRIALLREWLKDLCSSENDYQNIIHLADANTKIYNSIISVIKQPTSKQEEYFNQKAKEAIEEVNRLLEDCTKGDIPDYATFNSEMGNLFNFGYHHKFLNKVFEVGQSFFQDITHYESGNTEWTDTSKKLFLKYKLFLSFILYSPEPMKTIFEQKLQEAKNYAI